MGHKGHCPPPSCATKWPTWLRDREWRGVGEEETELGKKGGDFQQPLGKKQFFHDVTGAYHRGGRMGQFGSGLNSSSADFFKPSLNFYQGIWTGFLNPGCSSMSKEELIYSRNENKIRRKQCARHKYTLVLIGTYIKPSFQSNGHK